MKAAAIFISIFCYIYQPQIPFTRKVLLYNLHDKPVNFTLNSKHKATVLLFLSPQCPLCQSYSLTINQIVEAYQPKNVQFVAIIPGKTYTRDEVIFFKNKYKLNRISFYFDKDLTLTKNVGATITPEVVVFNQNLKPVYMGRIDNWAYELGKKRSVITAHDLRDVLEKVINGKDVIFYKTKAVGCFIE